MFIIIRYCFVLFFSSLWLFGLAQVRPDIPEKENTPISFDDKKPLTPKDTVLCIPVYSSGCGDGDGFTDFAVEEIVNFGSGCADNTGFSGWSEYYELGPAFLIPGQTHDFIMKTGYNNQEVCIWIDFNDDCDLTGDELILTDFALSNAGQLYTASVLIPNDAIPGLHRMRARTNWQGSSSDPCASYTYGEAEDYFVMVGTLITGTLQGTVTKLSGGVPIENAVITLNGLIDYTLTTGSDGSYNNDNIMVGDYNVECYKEGFNIENTIITIEEDITSSLDFQLTQPTIEVDPLTLSVELAQNTTTQEEITITNSGNGPLSWSASMVLIEKESKDFLDLQFEYPLTGGSGEAGIETDGLYIYTTTWNGAGIHKYDLDGNLLETFNISGALALRDLAYDGNYFYGSSAIPLVYEMDFTNKVLVSTIAAPVNVRAIAWDNINEYFYANNWGEPVTMFDKTGTMLGSFNVGPEGESYYGFAYDFTSAGGPYLWGYGQAGNSMNEIVQIQLPFGNETGLIVNIEDKLSNPVFGAAGGLFTHPNLVFGKWTLGGAVQNEWMWGLELEDAVTWVWAQPNAGTLAGGSMETIMVNFDATDLQAGIYEAQIQFNSFPEVGNPVVNIEMNVIGGTLPCNLNAEWNCTDVSLSWEICPPDVEPDSFCVYRNDLTLAYTADTTYTNEMIFPDITYLYKVTYFLDGEESFHSNVESVNIPIPENLIPGNFGYTISGDNIILSWNTPSGCLTPVGYNLYADGAFLDFTINTTYTTTYVAPIVYWLVAVYYFGESEAAELQITTGIDNNSLNDVSIYPNPVKDQLYIQSGIMISRIEVLSLSGEKLIDQKLLANKAEIDFSNYNPGVYILEIVVGNKTEFVKFVKGK